MTDTVDKVIIPSSSEGTEQAAAELQGLANAYDGVTVASQSTEKSTTSVEGKFAALERRSGTTAGQLAQFEKIQQAVNVAVAQNPDLQERANAVLAAAEQRYGGVSQALQKQRDEMEKLASVQKTVNQVTGVTGLSDSGAQAADVAAYGAALDKLQAKYDPLFAAGQKYASVLAEISEAERVGAISAQTATKARLDQTSAYNTQIANLERVGQAQKQAAQFAVNQQTIVPDRGADIVAYGKQLDDLRAKYNPLFAAGQQYKSTLSEISQAAKVGALTEVEAAAAVAATKSAFVDKVAVLRQVKPALDDAAHSSEAFSTQAQSLFHAIRGAGEQLALGIPPTQALTAQMNHLSYAASGEGGLTGAFGQIASKINGLTISAAGFIAPMVALGGAMGVVSAVAIAAGVHWADAQTSVENALKGIGKQSGATASDINAIAESTAKGTNSTIGQAREFATIFASTGKIGKDNIDLATKATAGLAKSLGVDGTDAAKLLAAALADPAKGLGELEAKTGAYSLSTQDLVQSLVRQGEVEQARAVLIKGVADATKDAADKNGIWAASFKAVKDGFDLVGKDVTKGAELVRHDLGGPGPTTDVTKQDQLKTAQADLSSFQQALPNKLAGANAANDGIGDLALIKAINEQYADLINNVEKLKAAARDEALAPLNKSLKESATAADNAVNSYVPQIQKIKETEDAIKALEKAQEDQAIAGTQANGGGDSEALVAAQNLKKALQESRAEAAAYNLNVQEIGNSYQGVSTSVAMQLNSLEQQLPVAQAVTAEAKMQAQYALDYQQTLKATGNELAAEAVAGDKLALSQAAATASVQKQVESLKDSTEMIKAQQSGTEATTAAAIAYKNAIHSGASDAAASALSAATLSNYAAKAAASTQQMAAASRQAAQAFEDSARSARGLTIQAAGGVDNAAFGGIADKTAFGGGDSQFGTSVVGTPGTSTNISGAAVASSILLASAKIQDDAIKNQLADMVASMQAMSASDLANVSLGSLGINGAINTAETSGKPDAIGTVDSLYQLKNSQTNDNATKETNLKAEMAWLQSQPETIARDQQIVTLTQSMDQLTKATNANTDALSPYYSQDPRTSHIGFRSQGMSDGGYVDVPGSPSTNDNTIATIPVASGERIYVDPMNSIRGKSSGGMTQNITINAPITINGIAANKDEIGRTAYQAIQGASRQLRSVS